MTPEDFLMQAMLTQLQVGWVNLHFDPHAPGVRVPKFLIESEERREPSTLVLCYGYDMPKRIPDLTVNALGIKATLSFGASWHLTFVPWAAVFGVSDPQTNKSTMFPERLPAGVTINQEPASPPEPETPASQPPKSKPDRSHLRLVK